MRTSEHVGYGQPCGVLSLYSMCPINVSHHVVDYSWIPTVLGLPFGHHPLSAWPSPVKPLRRHRFAALRRASHEAFAAAAAVLEVPLRLSSHGFARGLCTGSSQVPPKPFGAKRTSTLRLTSEDMVDDTLRPDPASLQAFGQRPKVASPTMRSSEFSSLTCMQVVKILKAFRN